MWLLNLISVPTANPALRMKVWRALKASGAAVLRDGAYLLPSNDSCRDAFAKISAELQSGGGVALTLSVQGPEDAPFAPLFDRSKDYAELMVEIAEGSKGLGSCPEIESIRQVRRLRKSFGAISDIDFFPGESRTQAEAALIALELAAHRLLSPDEPRPIGHAVTRRRIADFKGKTWATRRRPWVDRLASAWLIRRFIDKKARILWLNTPADCPADALGFDFDGATFAHTGAHVTFETLLASFGLDERPALRRFGALVHCLDVGGIRPAEADGVESVLAGLSESITDDDQLLSAASGVFDGLLVAFEKGSQR